MNYHLYKEQEKPWEIEDKYELTASARNGRYHPGRSQ
jgi:hypothetical protein